MRAQFPDGVPEGPQAAGDVLAARRGALSLLTDQIHPFCDRTLAVLLLTAVFLHVHARTGSARIGALITLIQGLYEDGQGEAELAGSPMQFVRYAACELQSSEHREQLVDQLLMTLAKRRAVQSQNCINRP